MARIKVSNETIYFDYSRQAELLIKGAKVDRKNFQKWFKENIPVGSGNVLEYILAREIEKEKKQSGKQR